MADRLDGLFAAIDSADTDAFLGYLTSECTFRFGSSPALAGHAAVRAGVDGFFGSIAGCRHVLRKVLGDGRTLVCEGNVTYTRHNGTDVTLPFTNVFEVEGDLISEYKIYIDIGPLYAA